MSEKPAKPAASKLTSSRKPKMRRRQPDQGEISKRAYFIHLEEGGSDQLGNWLRAERRADGGLSLRPRSPDYDELARLLGGVAPRTARG